MKGYLLNIDQEVRSNEDYRRVLYTSAFSQLVVMSLMPDDELGEDLQPQHDQFIRFLEGDGSVVLGSDVYQVGPEDAVIIPAGLRHNVVSAADSYLKLYIIFSPPEYMDQLVQTNRVDDEQQYFDGTVTELP